jgi:hypothetical protein
MSTSRPVFDTKTLFPFGAQATPRTSPFQLPPRVICVGSAPAWVFKNPQIRDVTTFDSDESRSIDGRADADVIAQVVCNRMNFTAWIGNVP